MGLDEYLAQETRGARFESSGRFSIDFLKARDKLERFRLPSPSHYLLKAVQAAVLAGATEINVKVLADATIFRFDVRPESEVARFEAITLGLQNPFEIADSGVRALCQGMLGALLNPDEAVCWRVNSSTGSDALWLGAGGNKTASARYRAAPEVECILTQFRPPNWKIWQTARPRADDSKILDSLARYCPIPIKMEGRNLQGGFALSRRVDGELAPYFLFQSLVRVEPDQKHAFSMRRPPGSSYYKEGEIFVYRPLLWNPEDVGCQPSVQGDTCYFYEVKPDLSKPGDILRCQLAGAIESHLHSEAEVVFVCDGVASQPVGLKLGCKGLRIVASGQGLDLDASGFGIVQNEKFFDRLPRIRDHAQHLRDLVKSQLKRCSRPLSEGYETDSDVRVQNYRRLLEGAFG